MKIQTPQLPFEKSGSGIGTTLFLLALTAGIIYIHHRKGEFSIKRRSLG